MHATNPYNTLDAHCQIGLHQRAQADSLWSVQDLLSEMDKHGVAEALVVDCLSREFHPDDGNARISRLVADHPRLHPAWAALPHAEADEQPQPADFVDQLREAKAGLCWLYPRQYRFSLQDWCIDRFLEPLADAGVPIFINYNEVGNCGTSPDETDWDAVVALCRRWPTLPVIVTEHRIRRTNRLVYRAFDACPNLRLELSSYWLHHGIEKIVRDWGAERLIFGSNWPRLGHGQTLGNLTCAEISDEDKRRIAGNNLRELIAWCEPEHPAVKLPEPADEFSAFARTGQRPAEMTFADNHGHLGGRSPHYHLPDCHLDGIVAELDRMGVEKVCVFNFSGVYSDETFGNDRVMEAVRRYPDRFVGFTMLNPHRGPEQMLAELERGQAGGLRGVKLIPTYQGYPIEGPNIDIACQWAHDHQQCILNHHWGSPAQMERLVSTYTDACFFTGHTTTAYAEIMKRYDNLYVCSCPLLQPRKCEQVVAAIGADRFMFGSDLEDLPIAWGLGPILFADIPAADKRLILGDNLRRVLQRYSR